MKTKIKSLICIALTLVMLTMTVACQEKTNKPSKQPDVENDPEQQYGFDFEADYSIVYDNGQYFIVYDDISEYQNASNVDLASVDFATVSDFKNAVTKGLLTESQKATMAKAFQKSENGAVYICDFNNLYIPKLPKQSTVRSVSWSGEMYSFSISLEDGVTGSLLYLTNEQYEKMYQDDYQGFYDNQNVTITKTETLENGKEEIFYSTDAGDFKLVRYSVSSKGKNIIVDETYRLRLNYPISSTSSTVPSSIDIYCIDQDQKCIIYLYDLKKAPTDEWLLEFGLEKYVD